MTPSHSPFMSLKKIIKTDLAPQAIGPYSQATISGNHLYVSGQLGMDLGTNELPPDFKSQVKNALYNVKAIVEAAESRLDRVLKVTVYLTDMSNFPEFNDLYSEFFLAQPPARELVAVKELPKGGLVEISCIGFIHDVM